MAYTEPMDWVIIPQHEDTVNQDHPYFYGCRQTNDFRLFIASGCCAALIKRVGSASLSYESACTKCGRRFPISPYNGFKGEDEPFMLFWGQFPWGKIEKVMVEWLDFYFNLTKDGEKDIQFKFDGMTAEEQDRR